MHTFTPNQSQTSLPPTGRLLAFLQNKKPSQPNKASINTLDTTHEDQLADRLLPAFSFAITGYSIGDHVEYCITLKEEFSVLRRKVSRSYNFNTRYSKLEVLDERLGGMGLPQKKWFGNKNVSFVEKRKVELEKYLNKIAQCRKAEFYRFVKQIKNGEFNRGLKEKFSIE